MICEWCHGKRNDGEPRDTQEFGLDLTRAGYSDDRHIRMASIALCLACEIKIVDRVWADVELIKRGEG